MDDKEFTEVIKIVWMIKKFIRVTKTVWMTKNSLK